MKLSILTATYNRGEFLKNIYKSIIRNLDQGIEPEWIIVDDGSTDATKQIVNELISRRKFEIKYIEQENSGKMAAINNAVEKATGELIVDCDSDDYFTEDSFRKIYEIAGFLLQNYELYALCFLKQQGTEGKISGENFKKDYLITTMFDLYFKDEVEGEKILVFNSKIRKMFKHELEDGEKFVTEARMYHKMDEKYKILCINEIIEVGEYLTDGYTKNISNTYKSSPKGYYMYFKEIMQKDLKGVSRRKRMYIIKNYWKFKIYKWGRFLNYNF